MKISEIGENLGKQVLYAIPGSVRTSSYLLNAYIPKREEKTFKTDRIAGFKLSVFCDYSET